ncbi:class I SAM-dependent methyltransferase [Cyclobacterium plantarum]|uniref:Class I SAM-dependent methyltransferase n=1 Tax=Cyclobacterium plantarum TaxID=2716263 RepID=A0ABX0H6X6_9BACT|nr:class I SAM-dependent methyltransferase [Cyclobacterium plantarum]NHE56246.1 class I SAM-dependent methyltransferase [Cyclobacterium plantarum]
MEDLICTRSNKELLIRFLKELKKSWKRNGPILKQILYFPSFIKYNKDSKKTAVDWELPWITIEGINFLEKEILNPYMNVFEYGSGGSTLFFSKKVKTVFSVEHNLEWFTILRSKLESKSIGNVNLILYEPIPVMKDDYIVYKTRHEKRYFGYNFFDYVHSIDQFSDGFFDIIMIDGRSRIRCLNVVLNKLKIGGFLVFDNSDRSYYRESLKKFEHLLILKTFGPCISSLRFTSTNIYKKE